MLGIRSAAGRAVLHLSRARLLLPCLAVCLLAGLLVCAGATRAAEPPPGMSREQFDALVSAVAETLSRNIPATAPATRPAEAPAGDDDALDVVTERVAELAERTPGILAALPSLPSGTREVLGRLDSSATGGLSLGGFFARLLVAVLACVTLAGAIRLFLSPVRRGLMRPDEPVVSIGRAALAALVEAAGVFSVWLVSRVLLGSLLAGHAGQAALASAVLDVVVLGVCAAGVMEVWLRPGWPAARLAPVSDKEAHLLKRGLVAAVVIVAASRIWLSLHADGNHVSAALLVNAFLVSGTYLAVARSRQRGFGEWLAGLAARRPAEATIARAQSAFLGVALPFIGVIFLLRLYAALSGRPSVPLGTIATMTAVLVLLLGETLIRWALRHPHLGAERGSAGVRLLRSAMRLARAVMIAAVAITLARAWIVDALGLFSPADWQGWNRALWHAALAGFAGLLGWEVVRATTDSFVAPASAGPADGEEAVPDPAGSRLRTLAPLLRVSALVLIATLTALAVLAILGVNITPLIAGASILGLAISFGSQTLVRDIVSGIFYLAEDAFRVGEYIDCGKAKGTVEGFALRSVKLRHQNGQLHTIPFGQLGQVTNFSRDWSTVKFNLRFARDTDVEVLRKATKKIGQRLMEDPDYAGDFLEPLKMQGVVDILDDALVARFKFTVRPVRPSLIQRESIKRLLRDLPGAGVRFPQPLVSVLARAEDPRHPALVQPSATSAQPPGGEDSVDETRPQPARPAAE